MAKRILAAVIALAVTFFGIVAFCVVFGHLRIPGEDYTRFIAAVALLVSSLYVFRRTRRWPAVLLLVGSAAILVLETHEAIMYYMLQNHFDVITKNPWWWPTCTEDPRILHILSYLLYPMLCLPIAWFWYSFQVAHRHLTNR
jgi:hypothetical protein